MFIPIDTDSCHKKDGITLSNETGSLYNQKGKAIWFLKKHQLKKKSRQGIQTILTVKHTQ